MSNRLLWLITLPGATLLVAFLLAQQFLPPEPLITVEQFDGYHFEKFSPDGKHFLLCNHKDERSQLREIRTNRVVSSFEQKLRFPIFLSDGKYILRNNSDGSIWEAKTGRCLIPNLRGDSWRWGISRGRLARLDKDRNQVYYWDLQTGTAEVVRLDHPTTGLTYQFGTSDSHFAVSTALKLPLDELSRIGHPLPWGVMPSSVTVNTIYCCEIENPQAYTSVTLVGGLEGFNFSKSGKELVIQTYTRDRQILYFWHVENKRWARPPITFHTKHLDPSKVGRCVPEEAYLDNGRNFLVRWDDDGTTTYELFDCIAARGGIGAKVSGGVLEILEWPSRHRRYLAPLPSETRSLERAIAFTTDGKRVICETNKHTWDWWDSVRDVRQRVSTTHDSLDPVGAACYDTDGGTLLWELKGWLGRDREFSDDARYVATDLGIWELPPRPSSIKVFLVSLLAAFIVLAGCWLVWPRATNPQA